MKWIVVAVALTFLAGGCVSLTPVQRDSVADVQRFADATTAAYKLPPIRVTIDRATNLGIGAYYRQGNFYLNETQLDTGNVTALVAHELAHYVLGHDAPLTGAATLAESAQKQELRELDANAKAVEILAWVRAVPEDQALRMVYSYLLNVHRRLLRSPGEDLLGHRPPCDEIADLLGRYPRQLGWTGDLECAPRRPAVGG
jgi:hypothetical protein